MEGYPGNDDASCVPDQQHGSAADGSGEQDCDRDSREADQVGCHGIRGSLASVALQSWRANRRDHEQHLFEGLSVRRYARVCLFALFA